MNFRQTTGIQSVSDNQQLLQTAILAALTAGEKILDVYRGGRFRIRLKRDLSPVTLADRMAHETISEMLDPTGIPLLSEEGSKIKFEDRSQWQRYWLVDPLDGTKEFISRNDEFTVNIALIAGGDPVLGIIYAPVPDLLYYGSLQSGAFIVKEAMGMKPGDIPCNAVALPYPETAGLFRIVASRSHLNEETRDYIRKITEGYPGHELINKGSSLKLCLIAEGTAHLYPRFGPTMEWDIAAGDAIIRASGGQILTVDGGKPLTYNKPDLRNPFFIAWSKSAPGKANRTE